MLGSGVTPSLGPHTVTCGCDPLCSLSIFSFSWGNDFCPVSDAMFPTNTFQSPPGVFAHGLLTLPFLTVRINKVRPKRPKKVPATLERSTFKKFFLLFYLFERWSNKERGRERDFPGLGSAPNGHNGQGQARPKQEPGAASQPPTWVRGPSMWTTLCCFPRHSSRELDWGWSSPDWNQRPVECQHHRQQFYLLNHGANTLYFVNFFIFIRETDFTCFIYTDLEE